MPNATADFVALRAALASMLHRGPDDSGVFEDPGHGIGLAHARLSILDLSPLGHQPMLSDDGRVALVFNGWLREQGFTVMRFWNNEIMSNLDGVLATIMDAVTESPLSPGPSPARGLPYAHISPPPSRGRPGGGWGYRWISLDSVGY